MKRVEIKPRNNLTRCACVTHPHTNTQIDHAHIYIYIQLYIYIFMYVHIHTYTHTRTHRDTYLHISYHNTISPHISCIYPRSHLMCIYDIGIYIYIYIYVYTCVYIYITSISNIQYPISKAISISILFLNIFNPSSERRLVSCGHRDCECAQERCWAASFVAG